MAETYQERFQRRLDDYARDYKIDELNQSNDRAQLYLLINAELLLEAYQEKIEEIVASEDLLEKANELKKLSDLMRDGAEAVRKNQQLLAIDRKTRKSEESDDFAGWLRGIKREAKKFVDERLLKIYCKDCKVLVGRWSAVHDHTSYRVSVQCSQCKRYVETRREGRDVWFDMKNDSDWRKKYPVEIVNASSDTGFTADTLKEAYDLEDEFIIGGEEFSGAINETT